MSQNLIAEELLAEAKAEKTGSRAHGYSDNKTLCSGADIIMLLDAGARQIKLNIQQSDGRYIHEVQYKGHVFIATTRGSYEILKRYQK